jgi:hypothetical protein
MSRSASWSAATRVDVVAVDVTEHEQLEGSLHSHLAEALDYSGMAGAGPPSISRR